MSDALLSAAVDAGTLERDTRSTSLPSFGQLLRCDWGTYVSVRGQLARFHQAGSFGGKNMVVVLAEENASLSSHCIRREPADGGEFVHYFEFEDACLRIGAPAGAPLLRAQALSCLRRGDTVTIDGTPVTFVRAQIYRGEMVLLIAAGAPAQPMLQRLKAISRGDSEFGLSWHIVWHAGLCVRLASDRLITFEDVQRLRPGTRVTLGADGLAARLQGAYVY